MKHRRIQKLLSAYLDDELSPREHEKVEMHLRMCDECTEVLSDFDQNSQWVADLRQPTPPGIWEAVQEGIMREPPIKNRDRFSHLWRRWFFRPVPAAVGTFVTVCLMVALIYFNVNRNSFDDPLDFYVMIHTEYATYSLLTEDTIVDKQLESIEPDLPEETQIFLDAYLNNLQ